MNGLVLVYGECTEFYNVWANGEEWKLIKKVSRNLPKHHKKGGQSQNRIQRLCDEATANYVSEVAATAVKVFWNDTEKCVRIKGLVLAGNAQKKDMVGKKLDSRIKKVLKGTLTISGTESMEELVPMTTEFFEDNEEENKYVEMFLEDLHTCGGKAVYGLKEIDRALEEAMVEYLLVTKRFIKRYRKRAKKVGCTIIECRKPTLVQYGPAVGMRWYALQD